MASEPEPGPVTKVVGSLFFLALGIVAFICAGNSGDPEGKVMCGDDEMAPGDTCITWVNGSSTSRSYEEQEDQNDNLFGPVTYVIGGLIAIAVGIAGLADVGPKRNESSAYAWRPSEQAAHTPDSPLRRAAARRSQMDARSDRVAAATSRAPGRSDDEEAPVTMIGGGAKVEIGRSGITVRNGPEILAEFSDRPAELRLQWHEVRAIELDPGLTGMRTTLCAIDRYSGQQRALVDTWAFPKARLEWMAAFIERQSEGRVRLR